MSTVVHLAALPARSWRRRLAAATVALLVAARALPASEIAAKAPPLATTVVEVSALASPSYDADVVASLPAAVEFELTGAAEGGFLGVLYDGQQVFVPAANLSLSNRPGIDTAVTIEDTPLLDAPLRDANVRLTIPEGQTVILTGAAVDGFDAASYDGAGGWIDRRGLAR